MNLYEKHWVIRMLILEISPPMWYLEIKPLMLNSISMNIYVEFHGVIRNFHFHRSNSRQLSYIDGNEMDGKHSGFNDCIFFTRQELWQKNAVFGGLFFRIAAYPVILGSDNGRQGSYAFSYEMRTYLEPFRILKIKMTG